ncbi:MAG TPA: leucine-rich repeat domain-containing protein [Natronincola sp.]|nr:leucine-rich repeat domain-containing protein [Natronincola sp.]
MKRIEKRKSWFCLALLMIVLVSLTGCLGGGGKADSKVDLTVKVLGEGTVTPSVGKHSYSKDAVAELEANPAKDWEFSHWAGLVAETNKARTTIAMNMNKTVTAVFSADSGYVIEFVDQNLEQAIREEIGKPTEPITKGDVSSIDSFVAFGKNIEKLDGIEHLTGMSSLYVWFNNIKDLSPLAGLVNLYELSLRDNNIEDISPLAGLVSLKKLVLVENNISDIDIDISPLASLVNLEWLSLINSGLSDINVLLELENLKEVYISSNKLDLSEGSKAMEVIKALTDRGVKVDYEPW